MNKEIGIGVIIILLTLILALYSAKQNSKTDNIEVVIIENHEYFKCPSYGFNYSLTHKANCKFCVGEKNE